MIEIALESFLTIRPSTEKQKPVIVRCELSHLKPAESLR